MTQEEFVAAAVSGYKEINALQEQHPDSFYDFEVAYAQIRTDLGRQVPEKMTGFLSADRRKKKYPDHLRAGFCSQYARLQPLPNHFHISSRLQELMAYTAQLDCYIVSARKPCVPLL